MVANLTRYTVFQNEHCDWNCGLMPQHDGPLVKFEEAVEASSNSLQQLKAEIMTMVDEAIGDIELLHLDNAKYWLEKAVSKLSAI